MQNVLHIHARERTNYPRLLYDVMHMLIIQRSYHVMILGLIYSHVMILGLI